MPVASKTCSKCKIKKSSDQFSKMRNRPDGLQCQCKQCKSDWHYQHKNEPQYRATRSFSALRAKYWPTRTTLEVALIYRELLEKQDYCCAICKQKQINPAGPLSVDHCHTTGKVRGLLCGNCNTGIGLLQDSTTNLKQALAYLEGHQ